MRRLRRTRAGPGLAAALLLALAARPASSLSMRHSAAQALVAGARPGETYALGEAPVSLTIANTGRERVAVALTLEQTSPGLLKDGYEAVPAASWLSLERAALSLEPGAQQGVPARLKVPRRPGGLGQYQAELVSESSGADGARLRLNSSVLIDVADEEDEQSEQARKKARRKQGVEIAAAARERRFEAPLGRKFRLEGAVKIANVGTQPAVIVARVTAPEDTSPGLEPSPNPRFARLKERVERIGAQRVEELPLEFFAPDEPRYRGRTWAFDVEVEAIEALAPRAVKIRIYVKTPGGESKR